MVSVNGTSSEDQSVGAWRYPGLPFLLHLAVDPGNLALEPLWTLPMCRHSATTISVHLGRLRWPSA
jgi:hypothetical protein